MDDGRRKPDSVEDLPRARVTRRRWAVAVWAIPFVAVLIAGYLVYDRISDYGPEITIRFRDGSGIKVTQTPIRYRGVQVGEVTGIALSEDQRHVEVKARLQRTAASIAREGSVFWIVRPEVGIGNITGLGTVLSGPEIQALPGTGEERLEFTGLDSAPAGLELRGLKIVVRTSQLGSLQSHSPVYYRGVEVGVVQEATLTPDARAVDLHVLIRRPYVPLVRANSVFWNVSGVSVSGGLIRGVEVKLESLRSLAAGGINFATPNASARPAREGQVFLLHDTGKKEWLTWAPKIDLPRLKDDDGMPARKAAAAAAAASGK
ncbi:MAG TPA: MlaD family protein [Burkholderiales bacterium]|nr:MlaD family protein [Burkholderiales bacterium]